MALITRQNEPKNLLKLEQSILRLEKHIHHCVLVFSRSTENDFGERLSKETVHCSITQRM